MIRVTILTEWLVYSDIEYKVLSILFTADAKIYWPRHPRPFGLNTKLDMQGLRVRR